MERVAKELSQADPTYEEIGATLTGLRPTGFHHDYYDAEIGHGAIAYERAVTGLRQWKAHTARWISVFPDGAEVCTGATVVVMLGTKALALAAPCRIVGVIDEEDRWGFAYGTLPGHPEQGEELFLISRSADGVARFEVTAFSRPGDRLTRLSGPIARMIQRKGTESYLDALLRYAAEPDS
jgi:uncharacterized protein (UPF0548 family)